MAKLLLHICCGPCAAYVMQVLGSRFQVLGYYDNPNIYPAEEHEKRRDSLKKLAEIESFEVIFPPYNSKEYFETLGLGEMTEDRCEKLEKEVEAGKNIISQEKRCPLCYELRLRATAKEAQSFGFEYFSTTLLISPYQKLEKIKSIGEDLAKEYGVKFYFQDFTSGFNESKILSKEYGLYRQKYCGCLFSKYYK